MTDIPLQTAQEIVRRQQEVLFEVLDSNDTSYFLKLCDLVDPNVVITARDRRSGFSGRSLVHSAARNNDGTLKVLKYLVGLGCSVNIVDSAVSLKTPLMDAVSVCATNKVVFFIENGADLFAADASGENILHYAARTGICMLIRKIIETAINVLGCSEQKILEFANTRNNKKKLPEDVSTNETIRNILFNLRSVGMLPFKPKRNRRSSTKKLTNE